MEMNMRTTQSQLRWYVSFIKDHPQLLQGKNCPTAPHLIADMWLEIATNLNAMVGPTRSSDAWRESLRNWRKQLRSRARKVIAERNKTGGGQNPVSELTEFEQQALEALLLWRTTQTPYLDSRLKTTRKIFRHHIQRD
ncbi:PREDICTED: uncharacterized protein LOC108372237 [Rhagoletis zephyria]|uniref:uncharacterized protein LOC108372237 n=1 Tax=Rhagoletis zephyria TaxID=28612 RepID=UPI0008115C32|nr:PREDICTED: uncharacterized protein LOC108372237 [Rhagoletis zephyria]